MILSTLVPASTVSAISSSGSTSVLDASSKERGRRGSVVKRILQSLKYLSLKSRLYISEIILLNKKISVQFTCNT